MRGQLLNPYAVGVIDVGSPKLGHIGWSTYNVENQALASGELLDDFFSPFLQTLEKRGAVLGLEAPLFVPIRDELMLLTKGRKGEGNKPWSGGAGAQVLALNLPIMLYIFKHLSKTCTNIKWVINAAEFDASPFQVCLFEALVSGKNKGASHLEDAEIMRNFCLPYSKKSVLPPTILERESEISYFNLAASALFSEGLITDPALLKCPSPIYKPCLE